MSLTSFPTRAARHLAAAALYLMVLPLHALEPALPTDSVYQLPLPLSDQSGRAFSLATRRGRPQLVSMFYTSCQFVCPRLVDTVRDLVRGLPEAERPGVDVLLVTLDPARDDRDALAKMAGERHLDTRQWTLARADAADTRRLAAVLGIQYRQLPSGDFNHSTVVLLLDRDGRIVARSNRLGAPDPAFQQQLLDQVRR